VDCTPLRRCSKCTRFFSPVHFHKNKNIKKSDGLHIWCKACRCAVEKTKRKDPQWIELQRVKKAGNIPWRANELLRNIRRRSKAEGWEFDLDCDWLIQRLEAGICEISALPFDMSAIKGPYTPSVDRVIAGGGYTKRNCRVVLMCVNSALMNWGFEAFLPVAKAIAEAYR